MDIRIAAFIIAVAVVALGACAGGPIEDQYWKTGVHREEWAEIRSAIRRITSSPVTHCYRMTDQPGQLRRLMVITADGKTYHARKYRGHWYFKEVIIVV